MKDALMDKDDLDDELVSATPQQRNWRGIGVALLVILLICALITVAVVLLTPGLGGNEQFGGKVSLGEILAGNFTGVSYQAKWTQSGGIVYRAPNNSVMLLSISGSEVTSNELVNAEPFAQLFPVSKWYPSSNLHYMAFAHETKALYRHSRFSLYTVVQIKDGNTTHYENVGPKKDGKERLRLFRWNPADNSEDFVFVYGNNLYYQQDPFSDAVQVSDTGEQFVFNGVADWMYEEEILDTDAAVWWSPDGNLVAFAEFNDSDVTQIKYPIYEDSNPYPVIRSIPYPKAGQSVPTVRLMMWNKNKKDSLPFEIRPPSEVFHLGEYYLLRARWLSQSFTAIPGDLSLIAVWANRVQNITYCSICSYSSKQCTLNYKQEYAINKYKLWAIASNLDARYSTSNSYFVLLPEQSSDKNVYSHIANVTVSSDITRGRSVFLNTGNFDVQRIVGYNDRKDEVYYIASSPLPRKRHLYRIGATGSDNGQPECLSCWMDESMECGNVEASFGSDADTVLLSCNGPGRPRQVIWKVSTNETLMVVNNNTKLGQYLAKKALPGILYQTFDLGNGYEALVKLDLPPGLDPEKPEEVFPMILRVYAGPGNQEVRETYRVDIDTYFVSSRRYVVAHIDGRGSGGRGWKYLAPLYRSFGTVEMEDQLKTVELILRKNPFIHKGKVAVWGWSYGGFASAKLLVKDSRKLFKCAVSVAPVTDFRFYDAAYTERYMGLPKYNYEAYDKTKLSRNVTAFMNRNYMLIHGTSDDNVHFQNTAMLAKALTKANIQFNLMMYPNQDHSIPRTRPHLLTLLDNYFDKCFHQSA